MVKDSDGLRLLHSIAPKRPEAPAPMMILSFLMRGERHERYNTEGMRKSREISRPVASRNVVCNNYLLQKIHQNENADKKVVF
jgi:hypothetical protein